MSLKVVLWSGLCLLRFARGRQATEHWQAGHRGGSGLQGRSSRWWQRAGVVVATGDGEGGFQWRVSLSRVQSSTKMEGRTLKQGTDSL